MPPLGRPPRPERRSPASTGLSSTTPSSTARSATRRALRPSSGSSIRERKLVRARGAFPRADPEPEGSPSRRLRLSDPRGPPPETVYRDAVGIRGSAGHAEASASALGLGLPLVLPSMWGVSDHCADAITGRIFVMNYGITDDIAANINSIERANAATKSSRWALRSIRNEAGAER